MIINNTSITYFYSSELECCLSANHLIYASRLEQTSTTEVNNIVIQRNYTNYHTRYEMNILRTYAIYSKII